MFLEIEDGIEGLVHCSELNHEGDDWVEQYVVGRIMRAEIIHIECFLTRSQDKNVF